MVIEMSRFRSYDPVKDKEAVHRIWRETGWLEDGQEEAMDIFVEASRTSIADIDGEAECIVLTVPGSIRYLEEDLPFCCIASVTTSRIARKQGLAKKLTAESVAREASEGALVAGLGMFEQGFYDQLGFGTGPYEHWVAFDPASLTIETEPRIPKRLMKDDWEKVHESRLRRQRRHGACNIDSPKGTKAEIGWDKKAFGFGYFDSQGELTHHIWFATKQVEHGPYEVRWMAYRSKEQFLELMALIKNLGDQVRLIIMREPADIQLQDLMSKPFRGRQVTEKSTFENRINASAYWQMRILDLEGCMKKTHHSGEEVSFNLSIKDPIENVLDKDAPWRGIAGEYVVILGSHSRAQRGKDRKLPVLKASVNAFTRMWLGVRPASGLAVTDDLSGPEQLLRSLDRILSIPEPHPDWDF